MEFLLEYLNSRIVSLVEKIKSTEEERRVILQEVKTVKNAANNSGAGDAIFKNMCENLENFLENVFVTVQENEKRRETQKTRPIKRKCRYYNRGFCKYGEKCKFYHSSDICSDYVEEGICHKSECVERHPKVCRYWTGNSNGCRRDGSTCQYLHFVIGKEANSEDKNGTLDMSDEDYNEDVNDSCDQCVWVSNKSHDTPAHTKSLHRETPQNNPRGNLFSCDQGHDGHANKTCHEEHTREMDEDLEKIIAKYETPGDISEIDQDEIERICQKYEYA